MQTRRDQLQAYRFVTRRIVSALLSGEPETNERPMRRYGLAVFGGAMIATIVFAGAGVIGLHVPVRRAAAGLGHRHRAGDRRPLHVRSTASCTRWSTSPRPGSSWAPTVRPSSGCRSDPCRGTRAASRWASPTFPTRCPIAGRSKPCPGAPAACVAPRLRPTSPPTCSSAPSRRAARALADRALLVERRAEDDRHAVSWSRTACGSAIPEASRTAPRHGRGPADRGDAGRSSPASRPGRTFGCRASPTPANDGPRDRWRASGKIGQVYSPRNSTTCCSPTAWSRSGRSCATSCWPRTPRSQRSRRRRPRPPAAARPFEPAGFPTELPELAFASQPPGMVCLVRRPRTAPARSMSSRTRRRPALDDAVRPGPDRRRTARSWPTRCTFPGGRAAIVRLLPAPDDTTPNTTTYLVTDQGIRHAVAREDTAGVLSSLGLRWHRVDARPEQSALAAPARAGVRSG